MKNSKFNKVLFINYAYPPTNVIASQRHLNISREFAKYFDEVHVLSTKNYIYRKQLENVNIGFLKSIKYLFTLDALTLNGILTGKKLKNKPKTTQKNGVSLPTFFKKLLSSFPFEPIFYKGGILYIILTIINGLKIADKQTVIFSSYSPIADNISAYFIKLFKPSVYWICDYRDIPSYPNVNSEFFKKFKHNFCRKLTRKANLMTSVSEGLVDYMNDFNNNKYVIYNGINESAINTKTKINSKFTISYTGSLYFNRRNPEIIFKAFSMIIKKGYLKKEDLLINYAGKDELMWEKHLSKYDLKECSKLLGFIDFEQSLKLQQDSDLNLLLNESTPGLMGDLTGKLFEYLAAQKPIFAIIKGESKDLEMEEIINSVPYSALVYHSEVMFNESVERTFSYLKTIINNWKLNNKETKLNSSTMIDKFIWSKQIKEFTKYFNH